MKIHEVYKHDLFSYYVRIDYIDPIELGDDRKIRISKIDISPQGRLVIKSINDLLDAGIAEDTSLKINEEVEKHLGKCYMYELSKLSNLSEKDFLENYRELTESEKSIPKIKEMVERLS
jgi:hypothetical protein